MKEAIKMLVEFSLFYKTFLIIECGQRYSKPQEG